MTVTVKFIGELFLSIRFVVCAICAGFNRLRWVFFSEFAGRRSLLDPCRILWWLTTGMCENLWPDMRGAGRTEPDGTYPLKRPGYGARHLPGSECKNPPKLLSTWRKRQNQGVQKQALCLQRIITHAVHKTTPVRHKFRTG